MKTLTKTLTMLLIMLLAVSCSKDEGLLSTGDELSDVLKKTKTVYDGILFSGNSNYEAYVPKTGEILTPCGLGPLDFLCGLPCVATLNHDQGQWYTLVLTEGGERHVDFPLKITPSGIVKGYWPDEWSDFPLEFGGGGDDPDLIPLMSGHLGCDLHGPGVNKGTIMCTGTFDGENLTFYFRFNGLDNGEVSTFGPDNIWNLIDGPAKFEFSYHLTAD
jgi:hypothetical protein